MAIKKVWLEEDCTACGQCEDIFPSIQYFTIAST